MRICGLRPLRRCGILSASMENVMVTEALSRLEKCDFCGEPAEHACENMWLCDECYYKESVAYIAAHKEWRWEDE